MSEPIVRRFDEPTFTVPVSKVFETTLEGVDEQEPLPVLVDGEGPELESPIDEGLVMVGHRRIRTLSNYWHGGWQHAIRDTWLRKSVARRLGAVADRLPPRWGLAVFDAWRPIALQAELYDLAAADPRIEEGFMTKVSHDPRTPPPHLTGGAVDVTLTFDGIPLAPGCGFDDITHLAYTAVLEQEPGPDRELRRFLYWSMRAEGFVVIGFEWWHFEFGTRRWALVTGGLPVFGPAGPSRLESDENVAQVAP